MGKKLKREREDQEKSKVRGEIPSTNEDSHDKDTKPGELFMTRLKWM